MRNHLHALKTHNFYCWKNFHDVLEEDLRGSLSLSLSSTTIQYEQ